jgi:hypothetical protein
MGRRQIKRTKRFKTISKYPIEELLNTNSDQHTEDDKADIEVEIEWDKIKQSIILATSQTIGEKKIGRNAEWFDTECMDALKRKK